MLPALVCAGRWEEPQVPVQNPLRPSTHPGGAWTEQDYVSIQKISHHGGPHPVCTDVNPNNDADGPVGSLCPRVPVPPWMAAILSTQPAQGGPYPPRKAASLRVQGDCSCSCSWAPSVWPPVLPELPLGLPKPWRTGSLCCRGVLSPRSPTATPLAHCSSRWPIHSPHPGGATPSAIPLPSYVG